MFSCDIFQIEEFVFHNDFIPVCQLQGKTTRNALLLVKNMYFWTEKNTVEIHIML